MNSFQIMQWVFVVAVFVIVFITVLRILMEASSFRKEATVVLAFCVSVLCIVGVAQVIELPGPGTNSEAPTIAPQNPQYYVLLPFVALTVAVLMAQLLVLTGKILPGGKAKTNDSKDQGGIKDEDRETTWQTAEATDQRTVTRESNRK